MLIKIPTQILLEVDEKLKTGRYLINRTNPVIDLFQVERKLETNESLRTIYRTHKNTMDFRIIEVCKDGKITILF